jgi:PAS domain S-box-containing protein
LDGRKVRLVVARDITESKKIQNRLEESEEKFSKLFQTHTSSIALVRKKDHIIISVNSAFEELTGIKRDLLENESIQKVMGHLFSNMHGRNFHENLKAGRPIRNHEITLENSANKKITCLLSLSELKLGGDLHYLISLNDISTIKDTENAFMASERRLQNLLDSQTGYVIRTDLAGQITFYNKKYFQDYGFHHGKSPMMATDSIAESHLDAARTTVKNCIVNPGKIFQVELDKIDRNNNLRTSLWDFTYILGETGDSGEIQCVGIDITKRRRAENELQLRDIQFETLFESMAEGAIYHGLDGRVMGINPAAVKLLGIKTGRRQPGLSNFNLFHKHFDEHGIPIRKENHPALIAARDGKKCQQIIGFNDTKIGSIRWMSVTSVPEFQPGASLPFRILSTIHDITEIKKSLLFEKDRSRLLEDDFHRQNIEINKLSKLYQAIIENTGLAIMAADRTGKIGFINPALERMTGYSDSEIIKNHQRIIDFFDPREVNLAFTEITGKTDGDKEDVCQTLIHFMKDRSTEWTFYRKDSTHFPVKINLSTFKDEQDHIEGIVLIFSDITTEREFLQSLRASEEKFTRMFMDHGAVMLLIDPKSGDIRNANHAAGRFYGYDFDLVPRINITQINQASPELVMKRIDEALHQVNQCLIFSHKLNNGKIKLVEVHSTPIITNDITLLFSIIHDVTDREIFKNELAESEARWNFALEGAEEGVWDWNIETQQVFYSKQWLKMMGYQQEEVKNDFSDWELRIHPEDLESCLLNLREHLFGGSDAYINEYRLNRRDGTTIWVIDRGKVVRRSVDGTPLRMVCATKDITNQKLLENTLKDTIEKEKELNNLKSRFISIASHEFRTPLATIMASIESLNSYGARMTEGQKEGKLNKITAQAERLSQFVEDLLKLSKIQNREFLEEFEEIDLKRIILNLADELKPMLDRQQTVIMSFPDNETIINSEPKSVSLIINNLLNNAFKYSPAGGAIKVQLTEVGEGYFIRIIDDGIGIPQSEQQHLFKPFFRGSNTTHFSGTGLGLNIVKELVERLGGTVKINSKLNKGTEVVLFLPKSGIPEIEKAVLSNEENFDH